MHDKKWQEIIERVEDNFEVLEHETREFSESEGPGKVEYIIFQGPLGKMKLERVTKPLVVDKKVIGSRRIGSDVHETLVYSDTEKTHSFNAYRWEDDRDDWVVMEAGDTFSL